jgi:Type I site-specific restriction-modification system, R (restriction) subunit and related helicases
MKSFISEDDIEQAILQMLESPEFGYDVVHCDPSPEKMEVLPDGTGRSSKKQCVLPVVLRESLTRLNPEIPANKLDEIAQDLVRDYSGTDMTATNYALYKKIRDGVRVPFVKDGKPDFGDCFAYRFANPENNTFTAVSQMWIQGHYHFRRPDVLVFINGLPLALSNSRTAPSRLKKPTTRTSRITGKKSRICSL